MIFSDIPLRMAKCSEKQISQYLMLVFELLLSSVELETCGINHEQGLNVLLLFMSFT